MNAAPPTLLAAFAANRAFMAAVDLLTAVRADPTHGPAFREQTWRAVRKAHRANRAAQAALRAARVPADVRIAA